MGYTIKPGIVEDNEVILNAIYDAMVAGTEARFQVPPDSISRLTYKLREILKNTEIFTEECGGKFAGLGRMVSISVDPQTLDIVVSSKGFTQDKIRRPDEGIVFEQFKQHVARGGSMAMYQFKPSSGFSAEAFERACEGLGWQAVRTARQLADGMIEYAIAVDDRPERRVSKIPEKFRI